MRRIFSRCGITFALAILLVGCPGADSPSEKAATAGVSPVEIRVMTFNIEWGGTHVSFDNVVEAIRRSRADIVGIQEAEGNLERLAAELGWYFESRNYAISRFPLLDPPAAKGNYVLVEVKPGYVVALANLHLPSDPYGPDLVRDGAELNAVLLNEHAVRMPALQPYLDALPALIDAGMPTLVTGDFNSPTHTDWTTAMVGRRPFLYYPVEWPVSVAMHRIGFKDAWRDVFPDVADKPGLTWWAARPHLDAYVFGENDARDRIDLIWFAGPVETEAAQLVGEENAQGVTISVMPWPSDHRGVVATFTVQPVPVPNLVTTDRRVYREGDDVHVTCRFRGDGNAEISVTEFDSDRSVMSRHVQEPGARFELPSASAGHYLVTLTVAGTTSVRDFWVLSRDAVPALEITGSRFKVDEPVVIRWRNAPGNRNDYIAIYAEESQHNAEAMLAYAYVDALPAGSMELSALVSYTGWSMTPGNYVLKLLKDDGYEVLAQTTAFEIH